MENSQFWRLMKLVDRVALEDEDEDRALSSLTSALAAMEVTSIEAFHEHLSQHLFAIDGEKYAEHAGASGQSDDGFLYARCYVVACGEEYYSRVKRTPTEMQRSADQWCESLLYVAPNAWAASSGCDPSDWAFEATVRYESGSNPDLWAKAGA
ncbi:DUF4240 domain-containing protein [Xanthomonas axonopodis pv. poinsettiicola]|uniref:DUF4240 domain-containing protein n=1 Tax=Xanthomonas TaxID=338 RepID=UPI001E55EE3B|nr:DUF4240 domain-containing protein [Xanthomonas codiaei]MCC8539559.1 DUF4240 domain-containing protein [Xanthomonas codiaei]